MQNFKTINLSWEYFLKWKSGWEVLANYATINLQKLINY